MYKLLCTQIINDSWADFDIWDENCTIGQAFIMIDNFCNDNEYYYNLENIKSFDNGAEYKVTIDCIGYNENKGNNIKFTIKK